MARTDVASSFTTFAMRAVALAALMSGACAAPEGGGGPGTGGTTGTAGATGSGGNSTGGTTGSGGSSGPSTAGSAGPGTGGSTAGSAGPGTGGSTAGSGGSSGPGTGGSTAGSAGPGTGGSTAGSAGPGTGGSTAGSAGPGTGGSTAGSAGPGSGGSGGRGGAVGTAGMGGRGGTVGTAGMGGRGGGTAGVMGSAGNGSGGSTGTPSKEDEGADCAVPTIPAANTAIAKLPDPFKKIDGTMVASKADWRCRREEIKKLEEKYVYGPKPPPPMSVTGTVSTTSISVTVMDNGKSASFTATVSIPSGATQPVPAIISYGPLAGLDMAWLNSEGVAFINFNPTAVGAEGHGHSATAQVGAFYSLYSGGSATGLLTAWGWGVSRIIDLIEKSGSTIINPAAIGVTGCSRYGKGAFIAGVLDQRVALTLPVESGTAGVPIWRGIAKAENGENGNPSQSLSSAYSEQPWFGDPFQPFLNNVANNPIDTHELVAMIAPRGLFIMDNPHIGELSPKYGHVAALAGAEIYKALGAGDAIGYNSNVQSGTHCSVRPEWQTPFKNAVERFLKKTGTAAQTINAFSSQSGDLATWRDWTTPTLP